MFMWNFILLCMCSWNKSKKIWIITAVLLFAAAVAAIITIMAFLKEDKTVYREFQAIKGNLARGVTESGSVDVGTAVVSIEVDISEFTGRGNFTFDTGGLGGPGGDMMAGMMPGASDSGGSSDR